MTEHDGRIEERDFLLASLDDLEAEYAAGDLDDDDYAALKADYTTRAARVIRELEAALPATLAGVSQGCSFWTRAYTFLRR